MLSNDGLRTYRDAIRDFMIIIASNFWGVDHILPNQLNGGIPDGRRTVE
jgi:hypothetical protein